jgi:hypothetical protein
MTDTKRLCALCGLEVEIAGFQLQTTQGEKHFCCAGCKGLYRLLYPQQQLEQTPDQPD